MFEPPFFQQRREQAMAEQGWGVVVQAPAAGDPVGAHSYTVGLTARGLPELLVTSSIGEHAEDLLGDLGRRLCDRGRPFPDGERITVPAWGTVIIRDAVATWERSPDVAHQLYGADRVRIQQVVILDNAGEVAPYQEMLPGVR